MSDRIDNTNKPAVSASIAWVALIIGWLIPGASFIICGRWKRGLLLFALVSLTFGIGMALHSAVTWPTWSYRDENFNLINNLTFIVQMGSGALGLTSFMVANAPEPMTGFLASLAGVPQDPYYELGSYYLIVAGALNYFAIGNFYDRMINLQPRFVDQETSQTKVNQ